jgi:pimeloyl-ACP methyl ester carboxylesterase
MLDDYEKLWYLRLQYQSVSTLTLHTMHLVSKGMVKTFLGAVGYLTCGGDGDKSETPILCFHSSPRSSDEFLEVMPLLAASGRHVIALDTPGYGISESPCKSCSMDEIADAFLEVVDELGIDKFIVVGNLMGNFPAISLASRNPTRVSACILANIYYNEVSPDNDPKAKKAKTAEVAPIEDSFVLQDDGSHLSELHNKRAWLDPELRLRVVRSELNYLVNRRARYKKGIAIQDSSTFDFESQASITKCPTLCIRGEACLTFFDKIGLEGTKKFDAGSKLLGGEVKSICGPTSTLNMINQAPEVFAAFCNQFLKTQKL